jgi:hypothetical protein
MPRSGMPFAVHFPRVFEFLYLVEHAPFPRHSRAPRTFECPAAKSMCAAFSKQKTSARAPQKPVTNLSVAIGTGFPRFRTASTGSAHFCPVGQLFSPRLRAVLERKLKYETAHTILYASSLPAPGSKGAARAYILPAARTQHCTRAAAHISIFIFWLRGSANSKR